MSANQILLLTRDAMKTHRFETKDYRFGRLDHPTRDLDVAARLMKPSIGATHWYQRCLRVQDRAFRSAMELRYQVYCV